MMLRALVLSVAVGLAAAQCEQAHTVHFQLRSFINTRTHTNTLTAAPRARPLLTPRVSESRRRYRGVRQVVGSSHLFVCCPRWAAVSTAAS